MVRIRKPELHMAEFLYIDNVAACTSSTSTLSMRVNTQMRLATLGLSALMATGPLPLVGRVRYAQTLLLWQIIACTGSEPTPYLSNAAYKLEKTPYHAEHIPRTFQIAAKKIEHVANHIKKVLMELSG